MKPRIVVLGMMTKMPVAGIVWLTVQYLLGFRRLGYEPYYVEAHARTPSMFMTGPDDDASARAAQFIADTARRFGFSSQWAFHALHDDGRLYGMSETQLGRLYRSAAAIINLHGRTKPLPEHAQSERLVFLETDPVQLQIELHENHREAIAFLEPHTSFFTWAQNYHSQDCRLPRFDGFEFHTTRQPVVLDVWKNGVARRGSSFTTVANWRQGWRDVVFEGEVYSWSKHHEFLKVVDLPARTKQPFELALSGSTAEDRALLEAHGWRIRDALVVSRDVDQYREYIEGSAAEFTVAKDQNVRLRTGWFSDRSATYLAAGKPVVTQETGFSNILPAGEGLFGFTGIDDAAAAVDAIAAEPARHRRGAVEIAREFFDSDRVLGDLLEQIGLPERARATLSANGDRAAVNEPGPTEQARAREPRDRSILLVAHRFPPDGVAGVERYTEALASELSAAGEEVAVVARRPTGARPASEVRRVDFPDGRRVYRLVGGGVNRRLFLDGNERIEKQFAEVLAHFQPSVVHFNHVIDLSPRVLQLAHQTGAAVVLTLHDYYFACDRIVLRRTSGAICSGPEGGRACARTCFSGEGHDARTRWGLRTAYFRKLLTIPDIVVAPSEFAARYFTRFAGDGIDVVAVSNGVSVDRTVERTHDDWSTPRRRGALNLAYVGSVMPHKGIHVVIEALRDPRIPRANLVVFGDVGDRSYAAELRREAARNESLTFRLFGRFDPSHLPVLLHDVDCVVAPAQWNETFGLVTREALSLGVPVVAADVGALAEPIEEGVNGFTFTFNRSDHLADVLARLVVDEELLHRLREGAARTDVRSSRENAFEVRRIYDLAAARRREREVSQSDLAELEFLYDELLAAGFGATEAEREVVEVAR